MRIFPINQKFNKFYNYSNYLNWSSYEIISLKDYLKTFNPDFSILNQDLHATSSSTWTSVTLSAPSDTETVFKKFQPTGFEEPYYISFGGDLEYRQGVFAPQTNHYFCLNYKLKSQIENNILTEIGFNTAVSKGEIIPLQPNQVVILNKQPKGASTTTSPEKEELSSYLIMSQPSAGLYKIQNIMNGVQYGFVENGQVALGGNISFVIELTPTRYFISDEKTYSYWRENATEWTVQGGYWSNSTADVSTIVQNKTGTIWTNSYPLSHKSYLRQNNTFEEFMFDNYFESLEISIASHNTSMYKVSTDLSKEDIESILWENIYVSII